LNTLDALILKMVLLWDNPQEDVISQRLRKFRDARVAVEIAITLLTYLQTDDRNWQKKCPTLHLYI